MTALKPKLRLIENRRVQLARKTAPAPRPKRPRIRKAMRRLFLALCLLFLTLHAVGLAYRFVPIPITANMMLRPSGTDLRYEWTPIEALSPHLVHAVMAAEDSLFCAHDGIDFTAVQNAIADNKTGQARRGGSTISQQTAKNVFLWNGGGYVRKAGEAWAALFIDAVWGKRRVMEVYLNVAEWGDGIYGAEAAARIRFGKHAADLSAREAALLAAVLPSPNKWRVDPPSAFVSRRASTLSQRARIVANDRLSACVLE